MSKPFALLRGATRTQRTVIAVGALGLIVTATGCSSSSPAAASGSSKAEVKSVAFVGGVKDSPFYSAIDCGAKTEAKKLGVKYTYAAPNTFDPAAQQPVLSSVIAQQPQAILIAPTDKTAMFQPMHQAKAAGSNLITVDTKLSDASDLSSQINSDNVAGGALGADTLAKLIGGKGKVVALSEPPGTSTDDERVKGFVDRMKSKYPDIKVLATQYADHSAQTAAAKVSSVLAANPDLKGVFAVDNFTGDGAPIGVRNANARSKVKIVAFDAQPSQVQALRGGDIDAIISQDPYDMGVLGVQYAVALGKGETVAKSKITGLAAITKENIDDAKVAPYIYKSC
ncbi:ABC transporter substrate-binding protein [Streptomyces fulvoviolaceus]|uniref:ABC transporter substrate-binding protein n=1 Tax=Streptomyces fulvoviolaceus TaxID=285535 RepID=UPI0006947F71|nr:ABC transporter substrate-binding protein [Streptomyces fulvoviolaceus]MCT9080876.1 ABC transporter substrate-binding protein [Streptomyces fulvoviolaceus]